MPLQSFPTSTGKPSSTGYAQVFAIETEELDTIPAAVNMDIAAPITTVAGAVWTNLPFDTDAGAFLSTEEPDLAGTTDHVYTLTFFYPGRTSPLRVALNDFDGKYCTFIGVYPDGTREVIGDAKRGMRLLMNGENAKGSRVGYALTGKQTYGHLPYSYTDGTISQ